MMPITLLVRYGDGSISQVDRDLPTMDAACRHGVALADALGLDASPRQPAPRFVEGYVDERLAFSLTVIRGGLNPRAAVR